MPDGIPNRTPATPRLFPAALLALGLAVLSACTQAPTDSRRCFDMVAAGQHSHRMTEVPCPAEPAP